MRVGLGAAGAGAGLAVAAAGLWGATGGAALAALSGAALAVALSLPLAKRWRCGIENRVHALLALCADWYWEQDAEHRFTRIGGPKVASGALDPSRILGRRPWEIGLEEVSEAQMQALRQALARREPFRDFIFRVTLSDGTAHWSSVSGAPVYGRGGRFLGYRGTGRDITAQRLAELRLRKNLLELGAIFENASLGIVFTRNGRIARASVAFHEMFGYAPGELAGQPSRVVWPCEADYAEVDGAAAVVLAAGERYETERLARRRDGSTFLARVVARAVERGAPQRGTIWIFEDVTEKRATEERLYAEKERAQATLQAIRDGVIVTDPRGFIEFLNPTAERITGCDLLSAAGAHVACVLNIVDEASGAPLADPVSRMLEAGDVIEEQPSAVLARADAARLLIDYSAAPILGRDGSLQGAVIALRDVTRQREMAERVRWQATHDPLTRLINRAEFERRVEEAIADVRRGGGPHALLFLDLDQFKVVNDTCGHAAGDELLRQLTQVLSAHIRQTDALARLGGDEFGVLLPGCPIAPARRVAEKLRQAVEGFQFAWQDKIFRVGVSVGGVPIDDPHRSLAELLAAADSACYHAKDSGRNRVHFAAGDDREIAERQGQMAWVAQIHRALEQDRFRLWAQEIQPVGAAACAGDHFEVLLRMVDAEGRLVPPMAFLPAAERYHLMPAIDRWVVRTALAMLGAAYRGNGRRLVCASLNVSGASVGDEHFFVCVRDCLAEHAIDPRTICFEITETAAIANLRGATGFIGELKALGCRFALDDFGSGMSSFAYLKSLPVDYLKIDGCFVKEMDRDPVARAMVEAIHRVGHVMGIATVAEFVENDAIRAALAEIGIDYAQGYGVARPRPLAELLAEQPTGGLAHDAREGVDPGRAVVEAGHALKRAAA